MTHDKPGSLLERLCSTLPRLSLIIAEGRQKPPSLDGRAVVVAVNVCSELIPDILNELLGLLLQDSAMWILWKMEGWGVGGGWLGASRTVCIQRL